MRDDTPVYQESLGGSLIDAARIAVLGAMHVLPDSAVVPLILLPGEEEPPPSTVHEHLHQAMQWLDAARALSITQASTPPTSLHIVTAPSSDSAAGGRQ